MDNASAEEYEWILCTVGNECVNTSLDQENNDTWQTSFTDILGWFCLLLSCPLVQMNYLQYQPFWLLLFPKKIVHIVPPEALLEQFLQVSTHFFFWGYESSFVEFSLNLLELEDERVKYSFLKRGDLVWCLLVVVQTDETDDCLEI